MEGFNPDDGKNHPSQVFDAHMDLFTLAFFVWDFPSRKEKFELQFEFKIKNWRPTVDGNFVNVKDRYININSLQVRSYRIGGLR